MKKTLLIGLDGMSYTLLKPLMEDGVMPFMKRFIEEGASAELRSTPCPVTPPAWTSIMTGRSPGHHGIFDFIRIDEDITDRIVFRLTNGRDVLTETLWSIAGRQGRLIGSLNFPQMFLARPFNGYMVPGFVTSRQFRTSIQPREFWDTVKSLPGFNVKDAAWDLNEGRKALGGDLDKNDYKEWIEYLCRKERSWFAIANELISRTDCELVALVFEGMDRLQHQAWHLLDPACVPENPTPEEVEVRGYCLDYYRMLDGFIRELVESTGGESHVFMVSDHGFGATTEIFYANVWLERQGYLKWKDGIESDGKGMLTAHNMREHFDTIDWGETTAYARTTSANGVYIRVAKAPGQPGIPPHRYRKFRSELAGALRSYKDPLTNTLVVTKIATREEAFPGRAMKEAPDLTLTLRDGGFISILKSDEIIKPRKKVHGTHSPEGIFVAGGSGIRKGVRLAHKTVLDVAPTLLYSMGLPVPEDFEGEVITDAFTGEFLGSNPVRTGSATAPLGEPAAERESERLKESEEAQILERLKDLGYFE